MDPHDISVNLAQSITAIALSAVGGLIMMSRKAEGETAERLIEASHAKFTLIFPSHLERCLSHGKELAELGLTPFCLSTDNEILKQAIPCNTVFFLPSDHVDSILEKIKTDVSTGRYNVQETLAGD